MSFCFAVQNLTEIGLSLKSDNRMAKKRFLKWRQSAILNFRGPIVQSLKSPCRTSYRSSIEITALNWENSVFVRILATDKRTDERTNEPMDNIDALRRSRCRERRLNNIKNGIIVTRNDCTN